MPTSDSTQISPDDLVGPLRRPYVDFTEKVSALDSALGTAARATRILPTVLGGREPRRYLLLVQNNAEPRALGGLVGSVIELRAQRGRVKLVGQRSGGSFGDFGQPVKKLSTAEKALYGTQLGRFIQNVTGNPGLPPRRSARDGDVVPQDGPARGRRGRDRSGRSR